MVTNDTQPGEPRASLPVEQWAEQTFAIFWDKICLLNVQQCDQTHNTYITSVSAIFLKKIRAYNVKSSSSLLSENIQWRAFKTMWSREAYLRSRFKKFLNKSSNFFRNFQNFFHMFLRSQCTFGTKNPKNPNTGTSSKMALFQKTWWKGVKEHSFNLFIERGIVEDCVAVILPPQLTL